MKHLIAAALALASTAAAAEDSWTGRDKALHFTGSAAIAGVVTAAAKSESAGFWTSVAVGAAKEARDYKHRDRHTASWKDFAADVAGAYVGAKLGGLTIQPQEKGLKVVKTWKLS